MSTYIKAVVKVANSESMGLTSHDHTNNSEDRSANFRSMLSKCVEAGYKAFEFDGHIFAIIPPKKDDASIRFLQTPFDLEDFEV